jgi:hypothetical protein
MATYLTSNEANIQSTIAGVTFPPVQSWKSYEGGDPMSETGQILPGNVMPAVATPGIVKRTNVTVERPYTMEVHAQILNIEGAVNNRMSASYTPTDADGNPNGLTVTRTGIFKGPKIPKWDSEDGKPALIGFVMECDT